MRARIRDIATAASEVFEVNRDEIMGPSRAVQIMAARKAVYLAAHLEGHSYPEIGGIMGREHSTVKYGVARALERYGRNPGYASRIEDVRSRAKVLFRPVTHFMTQAERLEAKEARERQVDPRLRGLDTTERDHIVAMKRGSEALLAALRAAA